MDSGAMVLSTVDGIVDYVDGCDVVIINTCGFIDDAKKEAIENILDTVELKKEGLVRKIIVAGCLAQRHKEEIAKEIPEVDAVIGIGADGAVVIEASKTADAKMRIFNSDGTEGRMGGNAIRCVGKYLYDKVIVPREDMEIETLSGVKKLKVYTMEGEVVAARVDMGKAETKPDLIPVVSGKEIVKNEPITVAGETFNITCVGVGNPHAVVFTDNLDTVNLEKIGPELEHHPMFPDRVNVEFVNVIDKNTLKMRVWERGIGETLACGTGACAAAVAAILNGFSEKETDITVKLPGGDLKIRYTDETIQMTGPAVKSFEGTISF